MKSKKYYNLSDLARETGVTRQAVYYWIRKGWIKPGRDYRNYPVFTGRDMAAIKKWKSRIIRIEPGAPVSRAQDEAVSGGLPAEPPLTWNEIQRMLYG